MTDRNESHGFLHIPGSRVIATGTRHDGCAGTVVETPADWSPRAQAVILDKCPDKITKLYVHNLRREDGLDNLPDPEADEDDSLNA